MTPFDPVPTGPCIDLPIREKANQEPEGRSKGNQRETVGTRGQSGSDRAIVILLESRIKAGSDRPCGLNGPSKV